jgi:hypothetical protein
MADRSWLALAKAVGGGHPPNPLSWRSEAQYQDAGQEDSVASAGNLLRSPSKCFHGRDAEIRLYWKDDYGLAHR